MIIDTRFDVGDIFYYVEEDVLGLDEANIMEFVLDSVDIKLCDAKKPIIAYWAHPYCHCFENTRLVSDKSWQIRNNNMMFKTMDEAHEAYLKSEKKRKEGRKETLDGLIDCYEKYIAKFKKEKEKLK